MSRHHFAKKRIDVHILTLTKYLEKRKAEGLGVPRAAGTKGHIGISAISKATKIPIQVLENPRVHRIIEDCAKEIGFGDPVPNTKLESAIGQALLYIYKIKLYLERLKSEGRKIPEHPERLGMPHSERVASDCGISPDALRAGSMARAKLDEGIKEIGLQIYVDDPIWTKLTYGQLLEDGMILRASELDGKAGAKQQLYNSTCALRLWMRSLELTNEDFIGTEFFEQFSQKLEDIHRHIESKTTKSKFSGEMRHWV
jgi:hypothetical protein